MASEITQNPVLEEGPAMERSAEAETDPTATFKTPWGEAEAPSMENQFYKVG